MCRSLQSRQYLYCWKLKLLHISFTFEHGHDLGQASSKSKTPIPFSSKWDVHQLDWLWELNRYNTPYPFRKDPSSSSPTPTIFTTKIQIIKLKTKYMGRARDLNWNSTIHIHQKLVIFHIKLMTLWLQTTPAPTNNLPSHRTWWIDSRVGSSFWQLKQWPKAARWKKAPY